MSQTSDDSFLDSIAEASALERVRRPGQSDDEYFRAILDELPVAVYATDADGLITYFNEAAAALWGCRPELMKNRWCGSWKLYWPDGSPMNHADCPMATALRTGKPVRDKEAIAERPDGTRVHFAPYPTPLFDEDGALIGGVNLLVDITDRKRDGEHARRLASIVESSDDAIISESLTGIIESWNRGAERLFGYTADEVVGKPVSILMPEDRPDEGIEIIRRLLRGEVVDHYETVRRHKDGRAIDVSLTVSPVLDEFGRVVAASKIARDITDRKRVGEHARRLASIVESSDDAIISESLTGIIESWNAGAERLFGYTADEVVGKPVSILMPEDRPDEGLEIIQKLLRGEIVEHYETVRRHKDGHAIDVSLTVSPVLDEYGRIVAASKIARDITDRRRAQEQQQLVLEEMRHRIKNTLATVQGIARQTLASASAEERAAFIGRLRTLAEAHNLLTHENWDRARIGDVVARALRPFQDRRGARLCIKGPDDAWLSADRALHLTMVLHELATNAVKYGALSNATGTVSLRWSERRGQLAMIWRESGGPAVSGPGRAGFGSKLIDRTVAGLGKGRVRYLPQGLVCAMLTAS